MSGPSQLRRRLGRLRRTTRYVPLARSRRATPYVGWVGEGNLGDEAMFLAHRDLLPELALTSLPNVHPSGPSVVARLPWLTCPAICLGGGTLVGNGHFRQTLDAALRAWPVVPAFALGVGVEDPVYEEGRRTSVLAELEAWRGTLGRVGHLSVRGPRSQAALASIGVEVDVVGDSALALPGIVRRPVEPGLVGVNVGIVDDQWGGVEGFRSWCVALVRALSAAGRRVVLVSTFRPDDAYLQALADEVGGAIEVVRAHTPAQVAGELSRCEVLVAHKLHAAILAAAVDVPAIALEYRPKCRDFQESVGRGEFVMRTDALDTTQLTGWVDDALAHREAQSAALRGHVDELKAGLLRARDEVRALLAD